MLRYSLSGAKRRDAAERILRLHAARALVGDSVKITLDLPGRRLLEFLRV